ncbi:MAG: hypothetical protein WCG76_03495 [Verrucomicrobiota bacterium]
MKTKTLVITLAAVFALAQVSRADIIDIQALWSGAQFSNGASATATFTLDTSLFNNPGFSSFSGAAFSNAFQNFQLTVSGASSGNGVFTGSDFSVIFLNTAGGTLDFHSELVGQTTPGGLWGAASFPTVVGDFNLFSNGFSALTPTGASIFTLLAGSGESIQLTSFAPAAPVAVPETSTWVMGFLALGAVAFIARRPIAAWRSI